jgi:hypothetical protein
MSRFWALALDYEEEPPPPGFSSWAEFAERNELPPQLWRAAVVDPERKRPRLFFQPVPEGKCSEGRVGSASAGISQHMLILDRHFGSAADRHCWDDHRVALPPP